MKLQTMGKIFLRIFIIILSIAFVKAQQIKIGKNLMNIKPSVLLELEDTNKALLLTRVFNPNISIKNPWKGMLVFDSTINKLAYYNGTDWIYQSKDINIYDVDGSINSVTNNTRTVNKNGHKLLFNSNSPNDTILFDTIGRVGIGTFKPEKRLHVLGGTVLQASNINNTEPANVLQLKNIPQQSGDLYMSFYKNNAATPTFVVGHFNAIGPEEEQYFTINMRNRQDIGYGFRIVNSKIGGQVFDLDSLAKLNLFAQDGCNVIPAVTIRFPKDTNTTQSSYLLGLSLDPGSDKQIPTPASLNAKNKLAFGIATQLVKFPSPPYRSNTFSEYASIWLRNPYNPTLGFSLYRNDVNNGNGTIPGMKDIMLLSIDQPKRGGTVTDVLGNGNATLKLMPTQPNRYIRLSFADMTTTATQWEFRKVGEEFAFGGNKGFPNDLFLMKDSSTPIIQYQYSSGNIYFWKSVYVDNVEIVSDKRLKNIQGVVNPNDALSAINKIKIVDYTLKKDTTKNLNIKRGVIAQDVEKVLPQAVNMSKGRTPFSSSNIERYAEFKRIDTTKKENWFIEINLSNHGLEPNDKIYLLYKDNFMSKDTLLEVLPYVPNNHQFRIPYSTSIAKTKMVYIKGQDIQDMRSVNYNYLSITNIAATQELSKELDQANQKIKSLEDDVAELKKIIKTLITPTSK